MSSRPAPHQDMRAVDDNVSTSRGIGTGTGYESAPGVPTPGAVLEQGLCQQVGADLFFPEGRDHGAVKRAKQVCRACPVLAACRAWSVSDPTLTDGIYAALTGKERRALRNGRPIVFPCEDCGRELGSAGSLRSHRAGHCPSPRAA